MSNADAKDLPALPPNHHAGQGSFAGLPGLLLGLMMAFVGRANATVVADAAAVGPGDHVADLGCGPGNAAREAARRGAEVVGIDPSPMMRRVAGWLTPALARVVFQHGFAEAIPLADGAATVLWSVLSVHHWPDLPGGLREAARVLARGGRFVVVEKKVKEGATGLASHGWTPAQAELFATMLAEHGFVEAQISERPSGWGYALVVAARRG